MDVADEKRSGDGVYVFDCGEVEVLKWGGAAGCTMIVKGFRGSCGVGSPGCYFSFFFGMLDGERGIWGPGPCAWFLASFLVMGEI